LLRVFEVAVGLTWRNGAVLRQSLYRIAKLIDLPKQDACAIEALGLLAIAARRSNSTLARVT
jgi:hypothetical protein